MARCASSRQRPRGHGCARLQQRRPIAEHRQRPPRRPRRRPPDRASHSRRHRLLARLRRHQCNRRRSHHRRAARIRLRRDAGGTNLGFVTGPRSVAAPNRHTLATPLRRRRACRSRLGSRRARLTPAQPPFDGGVAGQAEIDAARAFRAILGDRASFSHRCGKVARCGRSCPPKARGRLADQAAAEADGYCMRS
jgi:hypothetical protein